MGQFIFGNPIFYCGRYVDAFKTADYLMKTIIIIDPNLNLLEVLCYALSMKNYEAIGYSGYELELVDLIQNLIPSLILINLSIPIEEHIKSCCELKSLYPNLPIVAMSCNQNILKKNKPQIFDDIIDKPFDLNCLYILIEKHAEITG